MKCIITTLPPAGWWWLRHRKSSEVLTRWWPTHWFWAKSSLFSSHIDLRTLVQENGFICWHIFKKYFKWMWISAGECSLWTAQAEQQTNNPDDFFIISGGKPKVSLAGALPTLDLCNKEKQHTGPKWNNTVRCEKHIKPLLKLGKADGSVARRR